MQTLSDKSLSTKLVEVTGVVQGVGFRPFIYRLAKKFELTGTVKNCGGTVHIEVTGRNRNIEKFLYEIKHSNPPASVVKEVLVINSPLITFNEFQITKSSANNQTSLEISPDLATCGECISELMDSENRRYKYPFTNCTNCGPRYTIIQAMPYDRELTTMSKFRMCKLCQSEYEDVLDRRFHAQPNACASCGPELEFKPSQESGYDYGNEHALQKAVYELKEGRILAIKGLGGFHLACDATNSSAIEDLRKHKARESKPFAVMMKDMLMIENYCNVSEQEKELLVGSKKPIVLLKNKESNCLPELISCGIDTTGVMLPYTPLHHLLLDAVDRPLVMTSGNISDEPICISNQEAFKKLAGIANGFLFHNREIENRYDDSVVRVYAKAPRLIRRARGYAPSILALPVKADKTVLALGGQLKNTVCFAYDSKALVSQHIGDLESLEARNHFEHTISKYSEFFDLKPEIIAYDMHPDYSTNSTIAKWLSNDSPILFGQDSKFVAVQHHHAHIASCMAENNLNEKVIGVAFDGIGFGSDQSFWGGEFFTCTYKSFERVAHLDYVKMIGGYKAVKEPWRMALAYLVRDSLVNHSLGRAYTGRLKSKYGAKFIDQVLKILEGPSEQPITSSSGRLFDAISSMLGILDCSNYEGHAAMLLEANANLYDTTSDSLEPYPFSFDVQSKSIKTSDLIRAILVDKENGIDICEIAYRFHLTLAHIVKAVCLEIRARTSLNKVCLSGGVFQNKLLTNLTDRLLTQEEFSVYSQSNLPANDGGLALGQALIALAKSGSIIGRGHSE